MEVIKNGKIYTVAEYGKKWTIKRDEGKLSVCVDVPKERCATEADLRAYISSSDLF